VGFGLCPFCKMHRDLMPYDIKGTKIFICIACFRTKLLETWVQVIWKKGPGIYLKTRANLDLRRSMSPAPCNKACYVFRFYACGSRIERIEDKTKSLSALDISWRYTWCHLSPWRKDLWSVGGIGWMVLLCSVHNGCILRNYLFGWSRNWSCSIFRCAIFHCSILITWLSPRGHCTVSKKTCTQHQY